MALNVQPQIWSDWVTAQMVEISNVLLTPYVQFDTSIAFQPGSIHVRIPNLKPLDTIGDDVRITSSTTLTPQDVGDFLEIAPILRSGNSIKITDVEVVAKGVEPLRVLAPQIAEYNIRQIQKKVAAVVKGVFATALATSHSYDASTSGDGLITPSAVITGLQTILGENIDSVTAILMNSKVYADLLKNGLVTQIFAPTYTDGIITNGSVPTFLGKRVIVNDTICQPWTQDTVTYYPTYVVGGQPIYVGYQKQLSIYNDFDPLVGGGQNILAWYAHYAVGFRGVSFTESIDNPSVSQLETGSNWTKVAPNDKMIKVVRIITK